ncbi:MAG: uroporphyrinogen decarboxylase family protein [Ardenticatenaceae bacterium]|nr:uroporphyrinogen decarboxylase family protein [Ardenticatenaceae bacterium]
MDSKERVETVLALGVPDRVPVFPQIGDHAGILAGLRYDAMYRNAEQAAEAHLAAWRRYGYDVVSIQVEPSWPVAEACGAEVTYPPDKCPWITSNPVEHEDALRALQVPDFRATRSTAVLLEGTRLLAERADAPVAAFMTGPLTFSLQLMPYTRFITATIKKRDFVKQLIRTSVAIIRAYGQALRDAGASIFVLCEHDVQMFSPTDFKELSLDFLPELFDLYPYTLLHLCGKVTPHLKANLNTLRALNGLNMINVGPHVDMAALKVALERKVGVAGNVDHVQLLPHATPAEVEEAARRALEAGKPGGGFMLAPGCEITADTPPENVQAFVGAAQKYGAC